MGKNIKQEKNIHEKEFFFILYIFLPNGKIAPDAF
jgi:hypothetical protein